MGTAVDVVMPTDTALRLSVARHTWAGYISHQPDAAASVQLNGRGASAISQWYSKHGFVKLPERVQDLVLLQLRKECLRTNQKAVIDAMAAATGPLTPNDIYEFITSCDDTAVPIIASGIQARATYNSLPPARPEDAEPKARVEWWESRGKGSSLSPTRSQSPAASPASATGTPSRRELLRRSLESTDFGLTPSTSRSPARKSSPKQEPPAAADEASPAPAWEDMLQERQAAKKYERAAGEICVVCGMREGQLPNTIKRYSVRLLFYWSARRLAQRTACAFHNWCQQCQINKGNAKLEKQLKKKKKDVVKKEAELKAAQEAYELQKKAGMKSRNNTLLAIEDNLTESIRASAAEKIANLLYGAGFRLMFVFLSKFEYARAARAIRTWRWAALSPAST